MPIFSPAPANDCPELVSRYEPVSLQTTGCVDRKSTSVKSQTPERSIGSGSSTTSMGASAQPTKVRASSQFRTGRFNRENFPKPDLESVENSRKSYAPMAVLHASGAADPKSTCRWFPGKCQIQRLISEVDISTNIDMFISMNTTVDANVASLSRTFHALSDPKRIEIVALLTNGVRCVCELTVVVGAKQPLMYFHLKILREANLV